MRMIIKEDMCMHEVGGNMPYYLSLLHAGDMRVDITNSSLQQAAFVQTLKIQGNFRKPNFSD